MFGVPVVVDILPVSCSKETPHPAASVQEPLESGVIVVNVEHSHRGQPDVSLVLSNRLL